MATYSIRYVCNNCGKSFSKEIPIGTRAPTATECPHCGVCNSGVKAQW